MNLLNLLHPYYEDNYKGNYMKYILVLITTIFLTSCEMNTHTVTEDMLICTGKIYNDENHKLFIKCNNNINYIVNAGKYRLHIEQEK